MTWCREIHCLPEVGGYLDQRASTMLQWEQMRNAELEAKQMLGRIQEARAAHAAGQAPPPQRH